jgi:hypothetical protein
MTDAARKPPRSTYGFPWSGRNGFGLFALHIHRFSR